MKKTFSRLLAFTLALALLGLVGCQSQDSGPVQTAGTQADAYADAVSIQLSDQGITVDGQPTSNHPTDPVYTANDIVFYPEGQDFTYGEGTQADGHSQSQADGHTVVHITQPGTYVLSGSLSAGQVAVDLGDEAEEDPNAVVTLVLNEVDITCTVAPAVIFYHVYECGSTDTETAVYNVDTSAAGANVVIADGTTNNISGSHVARIYKPGTVELSEDGTEVADAKKLHKYDAAFYSKQTMNVTGGPAGDGVLNITADNEGLDSELHLTINGGTINITSGNDGINTNEDGISVTTVNGGSVNILVTGSTGEGDGIDSNGWLVINGGSVTAAACSFSGDAGIDSDMGIYLNGGTLCASGNMLDRIAGGEATYAVFTFASTQTGGSTYTLKDAAGGTAGQWTPANDFTYLIVTGEGIAPGTYTLWQGETQLASGGAGMGAFPGGMGGMTPPEGMEMPENMEPPELPEGMEMPPQGQRPEGMEPPEGMDFPQDGQRPEGMERPQDGGFDPAQTQTNEDGTITLPDGTTIDPAQMGGGRGQGGGRFNGGMDAGGQLTTEFVLVQGGNTFSGVAPAA